MRPWARAHGNPTQRDVQEAYSARFNEAVGSCPRKRRKGGHPKGFVFDASMRPWARAHGNASQSEPHHHAGIASMRPWARAHGNMVRARPA